jgi:L-asparagine transporter-like permease
MKMSDLDSLKNRATTIIGFTGVLLSIVLSLITPNVYTFSIQLKQALTFILYCFIMSIVLGFSIILNKPHTVDHNKLLEYSIAFFAFGSMMLIALILEMLPLPLYLSLILLVAPFVSVYLIFNKTNKDAEEQSPTE